MPAQLEFEPWPLDLGEVRLKDRIGYGEPVQVRATNSGVTFLSDTTIRLDGPGADYVQLARDTGGAPGVWAAAGRGIVPHPEDIAPGESLKFWARGVFDPDTAEAALDFKVVVKTLSSGRR